MKMSRFFICAEKWLCLRCSNGFGKNKNYSGQRGELFLSSCGAKCVEKFSQFILSLSG